MMLRRTNRQIEVFDISLMAVVTKAMGAFLVLMLLLLPYYKGAPPSMTSPEEAQRAIAEARSQIAQASETRGEDAVALKRQLEAAQTALQRAGNSVRELKTELDQVWSQFSRTQKELSDSQKNIAQSRAAQAQLQSQLADTRDTLLIAQRVAAALQAKAKGTPVADSANDRPMVVLEYFTSPLCKSLSPLLLANFIPSDAAHPPKSGIDILPMATPLATRWASSDPMITRMHRQFLHLPSGLGTSYVSAAIDQAPPTGCDIGGQISAVAVQDSKAGAQQLNSHAVAFQKPIGVKGQLLLAVVERSDKDFAVREPTDADIAAWSKSLGGNVPPQPPAIQQRNSPFGPVGPPTSQDGNQPAAHTSTNDNAKQMIERQQEIRKQMEQHLLVRTPTGPSQPAEPEKPK
ncbi:MAG: hypothetical protein JSR99_15470 [Proteobacteria bacterium]|nr:hypothetical protein [Pseudomonadota bacterium]